MKLEASLQIQQTMKLAPQVIQSIEILQLPTMALIEHIHQELEENPVLEVKEDINPDAEDQKENNENNENNEEPETSSDNTENTEEPETSSDTESDTESNEEFEKYSLIAEEWNDYFSQTSKRKVNTSEVDPKQQAIENTAAKSVSLHEHLLGQLAFASNSEIIEELGENIIYNIDKNGYLQTSLDEIVTLYDNKVTMEQAEEALEVVQLMEPPGVGARDLKECLLLQLDKKKHNYALTKELILHHLEDIKSRKLPHIVNKTNHDLEAIKEVVHFISTLNPKPGSVFDSEIIPYVIPEVKVEFVDGKYEIILLNNNIPHIYINSFYNKVINKKNSEPETYGYVQKKINSAKWLIDAIEQRRNTLYKVTVNIVQYQQKFLEHGVLHLQTLKMQEVADAIGMHVSTVSRAISQKYVQTPQGIFELKFFFTGGFKTDSGSMESWETLRQKLADIIADEDKSNPYSDEDLMKQLKSCGTDIARRTITKYRRIMKIPSSRQRRVY